MRITVIVDDGEVTTSRTSESPAPGTTGQVPPELLAAATASGALSAGPAPVGPPEAGAPPPFTSAEQYGADQSAGAAPGFSSPATEVVAAEPVPENEEQPDG